MTSHAINGNWKSELIEGIAKAHDKPKTVTTNTQQTTNKHNRQSERQSERKEPKEFAV